MLKLNFVQILISDKHLNQPYAICADPHLYTLSQFDSFFFIITFL